VSGPVEQGSAEWLAQRKGKITGSRVGGILGLNPYSSRDDVMREMVREWFGADSEFQGNAATEYGTKMEPQARAFYEALKRTPVVETDSVPHEDYTFISVSPDGLVGVDGMVEFKCPYYAPWPYTLDEKPYYRAQVQLCMEALDLEWCDFLVWFDPETYIGPGSHYHIEREARDRDWFASVLPELEAFHEEFTAIVNDGRRYKKFLRDAKEKSAEPVVDPRFVALAKHLAREEQLKAELKPVQEAIRDLRDDLAREHGTCTDGFVVVEVQERKGSVDWQKIYDAALEIPTFAESIGDPDNWRKEPTQVVSAKIIQKGASK
jgi:putative phage-type endonuclease